MAPRRVLVTGMSGLIGGALRRHLEGTYELSALNRRSIPGVKCHAADIADLDAIAPAFAGVDTVVHLAARTGSSDVFDEILKANVVGTYNVFEAARRAGVSRVVYASSGATVSAWERDPPYSALVAGRYDEAGTWKTMTHETPLRAAGLYGASKIWGEAIARHYADAYGLSAICVRIGRVRAEDRPSSRCSAASATSCACSSCALPRRPRSSSTPSTRSPTTAGATATSSTPAPCWASSRAIGRRTIADDS